VTLAANALVTAAEYATFAGGTVSLTDQPKIEAAISRASDLIQGYLGRRLILGAADYTEYHSLDRGDSELYLGDWPISSVTSVHEDTTRAYGATALLVEGTDYIVSKPGGKLIRIAGATSGKCSWALGFRAIKVLFKAGWAIADVPMRFKDACLHLTAILWREREQKTYGVSGQTADGTNFSRVTVSHLPAYIREQLDAERAPNFSLAWERDS